MKFNIYYDDSEYARVMGNPVLGVVEAGCKDEAEILASKNGLGGTAGVWAVEVQQDQEWKQHLNSLN
ncbi:hypothetical protein LC653_12950 [Nostoc sp. CHAB 5784]|uniref:hypothetical protein n=1 Tax=Nostoc mirabile TaxID=2907820 RepID=UPI001E57615F|nr:hypothetical protein [Nostoc mirabile]MCC5664800.1 hypothetical protein [Nostoc mirabile CHAB5784]